MAAAMSTRSVGVLLAIAFGAAFCGGSGASPSSPSSNGPPGNAGGLSFTFTVYNHTAGRIGAFTKTAPPASDLTLAISALGSPALDVSGVDPNRIVVREAAQAGRIGNFVAFSSRGTVTFTPSAAAYDVFLMNKTPSTDTADGWRDGPFYQAVDDWSAGHTANCFVVPNAGWGCIARKRDATVVRNPDEGTAGPGEPIDEAIRLWNDVLNPPFMSYGRVTKGTGSADVILQYTTRYSREQIFSTNPWGIYIDPGRLTRPLWYVWQQNLFSILTFTYPELDPMLPDDQKRWLKGGFVLMPGGGVSPIGRDLLRYVYVKDAKGW